jgi:hypothetical protein
VALLLAVLAVTGCGPVSRPPSEEEKRLVVTVEDLAAIGVTNVNVADCATLHTTTRLDRSRLTEYAYDSDKDTNSTEFLLLQSTCSREASERDARQKYLMLIDGFEASARGMGGRKLVEQEGLSRSGDEVYARRVLDGDAPVGNVVVIRQGRNVTTFLLLGPCVEDPDTLRKILEPALDRAAGKPAPPKAAGAPGT